MTVCVKLLLDCYTRSQHRRRLRHHPPSSRIRMVLFDIKGGIWNVSQSCTRSPYSVWPCDVDVWIEISHTLHSHLHCSANVVLLRYLHRSRSLAHASVKELKSKNGDFQPPESYSHNPNTCKKSRSEASWFCSGNRRSRADGRDKSHSLACSYTTTIVLRPLQVNPR